MLAAPACDCRGGPRRRLGLRLGRHLGDNRQQTLRKRRRELGAILLESLPKRRQLRVALCQVDDELCERLVGDANVVIELGAHLVDERQVLQLLHRVHR